MKKSLITTTCCALVLCTALLISACGSGSAPSSDTGTVEPVEPDSGENSDSASDGRSEDGIIISAESSPVSITMETPAKTELTDENGTLYFTSEHSYPVVSIEGNDAAADKINADILAEMEKVYAADETTADDALEWLDSVIADGSSVEDFFRAYSTSTSYSPQRSDENVISFTIYSYVDMGGAHGDYNISGVTYDTHTGEKLTFSELSDDPGAFRNTTLAYNQALAQTDAYSERMFTTDDITNGTLENVLYAEGVWYLSRTGLVFISNPYALGPYASGAFEFIIPYKDLADMGFKESYGYDGRTVIPLLEKQELSVDLNGDGTEDTISVYNEYTYDNETSRTINHLTVNGTDFADTVAQALQEEVWADIALYDLDTGDEYLDIALLVNYPEGDIYPPYSFFFRYEKDGSLSYLGRIKGYATDSSVSFTELMP